MKQKVNSFTNELIVITRSRLAKGLIEPYTKLNLVL